MRHEYAFQAITDSDTELETGGQYQYRADGEYHLFNPATISKLQHAVRASSYATYQEYSKLVDDQSRQLCTLRGLMKLKKAARALPLDKVEPAERNCQTVCHRRHVFRLDQQGSS